MKIVFLGPFGFHPNKTMRSRALPIARELVQAGHGVTMVMPPWQTPEEAEKRWTEDGVEIVYTAVSGGTLSIVRRMLQEVDRIQPDVVVGFKPKAYSGLALWRLWHRWRWGYPRPILMCDTDDWEGWGGWNDIAPYSTIQKYFFAWQERWGYTHCDFLSVASRELERKAAEVGTPAERVIYLPNGTGIDPTRPEGAEIAAKKEGWGLTGRPTLVLYSRLFEFDTARLVDILAGVHAHVPDLAILSIGAGLYDEDSQALREQLAEAGVLEAFVDVGWLDEAELPAAILAGDVGLYLMDDTLLNRTKCPVKLADLISVGLPVVGEAVGQVVEYVRQGENGFLRPSGDVPGLVEDLVRLLKDPQLRIEMGRAGRAHAQERFAWSIQAQTLLKAWASKRGG